MRHWSSASALNVGDEFILNGERMIVTGTAKEPPAGAHPRWAQVPWRYVRG